MPAASLEVEQRPGETFVGRFRYDERYLERKDAIALDPFQLPLDNAVREFTKLNGLPGAVRDAGPDYWGRHVVEYKLGRGMAELDEIDYLLNAPQDGAGNLAFSANRQRSAPKRGYNQVHQLADLITAAQAIEEGSGLPGHVLKSIELGTAIGGARPKATIEDGHRLWIGKFPQKLDRFSLQRVEYATLDLARRCGIDVCNARLQPVDGQDVLMLERFDRQYADGGYLRLGRVSALTVLESDDHPIDRERWSYLLLADQLRRWSVKPDADRRELFRRMVFNAAVSNNDDHARNHALLHTESGWRLSPAYDLVPAPLVSMEHRELAMTVGTYGRAASIYNLLSQCLRFGLSTDAARKEIDDVVRTVLGWRIFFRACGVSERDIEYIGPAFLPESFFFENPPPGSD